MTLEKFSNHINYDQFLVVRELQYKTLVTLSYWNDYLERRNKLILPPINECQLSYDDIVSIAGPISDQQLKQLEDLIIELHPWRKGPFNLFGIDIDAEWRSELKWKRVAPFIGDLSSKKVGDFGCNNGYYMFRMLAHNPDLVLGFDPNGRFYYQFELLNTLFQQPKLIYEPLGVEHADLFPDFFDLILCMGVIYHRRDPIETLRKVFTSLHHGGRLIIESITVPGDKNYTLIPKERYSKMRNVWFIPSALCLCDWLKQAGFSNINHIDTTVTTSHEQRKTKNATFDSLSDFLDPNDSTLTVEGYPAPSRSIIVAEKI